MDPRDLINKTVTKDSFKQQMKYEVDWYPEKYFHVHPKKKTVLEYLNDKWPQGLRGKPWEDVKWGQLLQIYLSSRKRDVVRNLTE